MIYIGMDVHQSSTTICLFDPSAQRQYQMLTRPTTAEALQQVLEPFDGHCQVAFEVGTQAQWIARIVRPLAAQVQVANPSRIPWLFRDGRKNDRLDARKLATLLYLGQLPTVHLPAPDVSAWRALINHRRTLLRRRTMRAGSREQVLNVGTSSIGFGEYRKPWFGAESWPRGPVRETPRLQRAQNAIANGVGQV